LVAFDEAFGEYEKMQGVTTKICALQQGSHVALVYEYDFRQLASVINWHDDTV